MAATVLLPTLSGINMKVFILTICLVMMIGAVLAESSDRKSRQTLPIAMEDDGLIMDEEAIPDAMAWDGDVVAMPTVLLPTGNAILLGGPTDQKTEEVRLHYGGGTYSRPLGGLYYGRPYGGGYYGRPNGFGRPQGGFSRPYGLGRQYTPNFGGYSQFGGLSNAGGVSNGQGNGNSGGGTVNYAGGYGSALGGGYPGAIGGGYGGGFGNAYTSGLSSGFVPVVGSGLGNGFALRPNYNFGK